MSVSVALATGLMSTRIKSDLEFKLQALSQRRIALLDESTKVGKCYNRCLSTPNPFDEKHCEWRLKILQAIDKKIEVQMKDLDTKLKIYREMAQSWLKASKKNAKESFTVGTA